ncbi:alanine racemase [Streptomyces sp. BE133]|uniref:alanine racemase n=1 Tax=Streptomyces sp. BE133 TaxID=3002523 RepID=UPI002E78732C|nr:alanine racemase [Streptomyces sp. BE133]MEE1806282.1 alanine racemase [Streptomyces sp. BE133]
MDRDDTVLTACPVPEMPQLRLDVRALEHNVHLMADWCRDQSVELCPHIKTTMTRPIVERQMAAGAWGVTVATVRQCGIALGWGVRRIVIANQVIHRPDLALLRRWLDATPGLELYCFMDSTAGVGLARAVMDGARNPLHVLVDVGAQGGRAGVRESAEAHDLARACQASPGLLLAGVAGYEGIRPNRRDAVTIADVDAHCRKAASLFHALAPLFQTARPVFSMGGSAFPDRVVRALSELTESPGRPLMVPVLRSGCYVTHDHGTYADVSPLPGLRPALTVRAVVLSTPEPGRIIVGAGKRELPYDAGLPVLIGSRDAQGAPRPAARAIAAHIYDHHLVLTDAHGLNVGDEVELGISHPCSAFDRWPDITVVNDKGDTQDVWHPQFR